MRDIYRNYFKQNHVLSIGIFLRFTVQCTFNEALKQPRNPLPFHRPHRNDTVYLL